MEYQMSVVVSKEEAPKMIAGLVKEGLTFKAFEKDQHDMLIVLTGGY